MWFLTAWMHSPALVLFERIYFWGQTIKPSTHVTNQITSDCDKNCHQTKGWGVFEEIRGMEGGWEGGGHYWQWWRRECITGSCVLYERDREGFTKKEMTWKRDSQIEREVSQPLKRTLRLTPSYSLPGSICKYSTLPEGSVLIVFDVVFVHFFIKSGGVKEENTFGLLWSHNKG